MPALGVSCFSKVESTSNVSEVSEETVDVGNTDGTEFKECLDNLLHEEEVSRKHKNIEANQKALKEILQLYVEHKKWGLLGDHIHLITNMRTGLRESVQKFIQEAVEISKTIVEDSIRIDFLTALRSSCDGKLFLEHEYVEATKQLASLYRRYGKMDEATKTLRGIKIENCGSISQREKVQYILLLMRFLILSDQPDEASILSKKILLNFLNDPKNEDLKMEFYGIKIELERDEFYLDVSKYYRILASCNSVSYDFKAEMQLNSAIFCALASECQERIELTETLVNDPHLKNISTAFKLLKLISSKELISMADGSQVFKDALLQTKDIDTQSRFGKKCLSVFDQRIIEHNILIISKNYSRIKLARMAQLIGISVQQCEENISGLVNNHILEARIDRFSGIVILLPPCANECMLNNWIQNASHLMGSINKASHHIQKELSLIIGNDENTKND